MQLVYRRKITHAPSEIIVQRLSSEADNEQDFRFRPVKPGNLLNYDELSQEYTWKFVFLIMTILWQYNMVSVSIINNKKPKTGLFILYCCLGNYLGYILL